MHGNQKQPRPPKELLSQGAPTAIASARGRASGRSPGASPASRGPVDRLSRTPMSSARGVASKLRRQRSVFRLARRPRDDWSAVTTVTVRPSACRREGTSRRSQRETRSGSVETITSLTAVAATS